MNTAKTTQNKKATTSKKNSIIISEDALPTFTNVKVEENRLIFELSDGRTVTTPLAWLPDVASLPVTLHNRLEIIGSGMHVYWPDSDTYLGVKNVLYGNRFFI